MDKLSFQQYLTNNCFSLRVVPHAKQTKLIEEDGKLKLYLHALPEKGKANQELISYFKKEYHLRVEIVLGERSRQKVIHIIAARGDKF